MMPRWHDWNRHRTCTGHGGTNLEIFNNELPDRCFDVGIAEEHAALVACGLSTEGTDVTLLGLGTMFGMAQQTQALLEKRGLSVALINPRFAEQCRVLCTFEDHVMLHGFGATVIDHLHGAGIHTPVERIAWPDEFIEHGKPEILRALHHLTPEAAVEKILAHF